MENHRVTNLELFFDLVFVFTITQLTSVLTQHPNARGVAEVVVMLLLVWWMYAGYAWLTNQIDVDTPAHRGFLLAAMAGWLVLALALPRAFSASGLTFSFAYLFIVCVHAGLFTHAQSRSSAAAFIAVGQTNLLFAAAIVAGGVVGGRAQWIIWALSGLGLWIVPEFRRRGVFEIDTSHFVERHGLLVIVALGESVVAIGIGASEVVVNASLVLVAVVGLALVAGMWWTYFSNEAEVQTSMGSAAAEQRAIMGVHGYGYAHWPILLGIVLVAAGLKQAAPHPLEGAKTAAAAFLGCGLAVFVAGQVLFRRALRLPVDRARLLAIVGALFTIPLGRVAALAQIGALVVVVGLLVATELRTVSKLQH